MIHGKTQAREMNAESVSVITKRISKPRNQRGQKKLTFCPEDGQRAAERGFYEEDRQAGAEDSYCCASSRHRGAQPGTEGRAAVVTLY